ncbi:endonuclease/exonuclease/phosphatase family protein [Phenylobacterium sp.]|uniref:endonuclease/exonuclease/phosphatase family protein n=1 Tax=Phenylobacterium sp. TaxID=1871053 RepID=UPI0025DBBB66|nr:endonuclease/exonuclease/phosphatase family protein [Phenylobacterium sp.]
MRRLFIGLLLLGSGAASVLAALAVFGGRFSVRLDILSHFLPFLVVGVAAAAGVFLLRPDVRATRAALAILVIGLGAAAWAMAPVFLYRQVRADRLDPALQIKVIQLNALDGNRRGPALLAWLKAQDADILVMEETPDIGDELPTLGYLASCGNCPATIYYKAAAKPYWDNGPTWDWMAPRKVAAARFRDARGDYTVLAVHRGRPTRFARTSDETAALRDMARRFPAKSTILAGDFNSTPWSAGRRREEAALGLVRQTRAVPTWPAEAVSHNRFGFPFPVLPIDHIYAGRDWATVKVERGPKLGSDHYPVMVTLQRVRGIPTPREGTR